MINKYGLFYNFDKNVDTLEVIFDDGSITSSNKINDDVEIFYNGDKVIKANIYNFKKYVKIRIKGLIYFPTYELISLINGYLGSFGLFLSFKQESGFYIDKCDKGFIVKAKKDTLLNNKKFAEEDHICSFNDLSINDSDNILIIESGFSIKDINKDFFALEENENA